MQRQEGGSINRLPAAAVTLAPTADSTTSRAPAPVREEAVLNMQCELGNKCIQAVRQRVAPLLRGCYPPFNWVTLGTGPRVDAINLDGISGVPPRATRVLAGAYLTINESVWDYLEHKLPVVRPRAIAVDGTVASDFVCVDLGGSGCCKERGHVCPMSSDGSDGGLEPEDDAWWKYMAVAGVSSLLSVVVTVSVMYTWAPRVSYSLVETDLYDPTKTKTLAEIEPEANSWWGWGVNESRGYTPFPRE